jgi:integrase
MAIWKLKPKDVERLNTRGMYADGGGLYLQVGEGGSAKSWIFRYSVPIGDGQYRDRQMGLGAVHTINIAAAREKARLCREIRMEGGDPIDQRDAERAALKLGAGKIKTFRDCATGYMENHKRTWGAKYAAAAPGYFERFIFPKLGDLPITKVDTHAVLEVLQPIHATNPPNADQVRVHIAGAWKWGAAHCGLEGQNPASLKGALGVLLANTKDVHEVKHKSALPFDQIGAFMAELRGYSDQRGAHGAYNFEGRGHPITAYALELIILTGVRSHQVTGTEWKEIDWTEKVWTCPGTRTKAKKRDQRDHVVLLSDQAMAVLEAMKAKGNPSPYVFTEGRGGSPIKPGSVGSFLDRSMNRDGKWTEKAADGGAGRPIVVHGFCTTFKSWSLEAGFDNNLSEMALHHTVGGDVERIYARDAKLLHQRREMMQAWAAHCERTEPLAPAKLLKLRKGGIR